MRQHALLGLLTFAPALMTLGCARTTDAPEGDRLTIGAYAVVREVFHDGLLPAFAAHWKAKTGRAVTFAESYNASGAQTRAIAAGFDVDLAALSLEDDMEALVRAGRVKPHWKTGPTKGMLSRSLVVVGCRPGNPKRIRDWDDLARPGVGVLYPDPKTSGSARWNIAAIFGAALLASKEAHGGEPVLEEVRERLARVQANVVNMDPSGRQSMANFVERGTGDVIISYENELLLGRKLGREIPHVIPPATLLIESPVALVETSVRRHKNREVADAFLAFLTGPEGQKILAEYGFRPSLDGVPAASDRPLPPQLFTIADLGGWPKVREEVFGPKGLWTSVFADRREGR